MGQTLEINDHLTTIAVKDQAAHSEEDSEEDSEVAEEDTTTILLHEMHPEETGTTTNLTTGKNHRPASNVEKEDTLHQTAEAHIQQLEKRLTTDQETTRTPK